MRIVVRRCVTNRSCAVVPDESGRAEAQRPALLLQAPAADIYVIARHAEPWIESPYGLETRLPECHVAPGDVLCHLVRQAYVIGVAGRVGDTIGDRFIAAERMR